MAGEDEIAASGSDSSTNQPTPAPVARPDATAAGDGVLDWARRLLMGGVGTVTMTLEEVHDLVQRMLGRGKVSDSELQRMVEEYVESRSTADVAHPADRPTNERTVSLHALPEKSPGALERHVETVLVRLNVPTRGDIENLSRRIAQLNEKVSRLKELRDAGCSKAETAPGDARTDA